MWRSIGQSFGYVFFDLSTLTVPLGSVDEVTLTLTTAHLQGEDLMITIWTNPVSPDGSLLDHYAGYDFFTPGMQITSVPMPPGTGPTATHVLSLGDAGKLAVTGAAGGILSLEVSASSPSEDYGIGFAGIAADPAQQPRLTITRVPDLPALPGWEALCLLVGLRRRRRQ
jgi:hypothetical protein